MGRVIRRLKGWFWWKIGIRSPSLALVRVLNGTADEHERRLVNQMCEEVDRIRNKASPEEQRMLDDAVSLRSDR